MIVYGWLVGPVAQVWLNWNGTDLPGMLVNWPADPTLQAYWLRARRLGTGRWRARSAAPSGSP